MSLPVILTLQNVLDVLDRAPIPDTRRSELRRDVRKAGRIICPIGDLGQIIVTSRMFKGQLDGISEHDIGCKTRKRRDNFLSNVRRAVEIATPLASSIASLPVDPAVSAAWDAIISLVPPASPLRYFRYRISKLVKYCKMHAIMPDAVPTDLRTRLVSWLRDSTWLTKPELHGRESCVAWNRLATVVEGWPQRPVAIDDKEDFTLSLEKMPAPLRADIETYLDYTRDPHKYDHLARCRRKRKPYGTSTIDLHIYQIRFAISHLAASGVPLDTITSLKQLAIGDNFERLMKHYDECERAKIQAKRQAGIEHEWGNVKTDSAFTTAKTIRTVICNWVGPNSMVIEKMNRIVAASRKSIWEIDGEKVEVFARQIGLPARVRNRLKKIGPDGFLRTRLVPKTIWSEVVRERDRRVKQGLAPAITRSMALRIMTAVAIAVEWRMPIRLENLRTIDLARHFTPPSGDRKTGWFNLVSVKLPKPLQIELDEAFLELLDFYLAECRPMITGGAPTTKLFPGDDTSKPMHENSLSRHISREMKRQLRGIPFSTHMFRHAIGMLICQNRPEKITEVAIVLGNTEATCRRHYLDDQSHLAPDIINRSVWERVQEAADPSLRRQLEGAI